MARSNHHRSATATSEHATPDEANCAALHAAAYRAARREIDLLALGATILYHEGLLAADAARHAAVAGRAAAFLETASEPRQGVLPQQRVRVRWSRYIFRKSQR